MPRRHEGAERDRQANEYTPTIETGALRATLCVGARFK
jgi:hypothetical protein